MTVTIEALAHKGEGRATVDGEDTLYGIKLQGLEMLGDLPEAPRTARYQALLVMMRHAEDPTPLICQGTWEGEIVLQPRGEHGFGYDPHFLLPDLGLTAAEMDPAEKNRVSHRGRAMAELIARLTGDRG